MAKNRHPFVIQAIEQMQRSKEKAEQAMRGASAQYILKEIGDNNTNQYKKTGHHS